jgi:hypothetical protein
MIIFIHINFISFSSQVLKLKFPIFNVNSSYQRSANSTLERRDNERRGGRESRGDSDEEDARGSRRQAPVRDLRNVIDKSRTKVQANKKRPAPIEEPPSEVSEEAGSEEGEVDSD